MSLFRKKRIKFAVELVVDRLTDVSLLNARLFAKVRLLDYGSFTASTEPQELRGHTCVLYAPPDAAAVDENAENRPTTSGRSGTPPEDPLYLLAENQADQQPFRFRCQIPYNQETLQLEECRCKISIRKVEWASRVPTKLGFVIVNLSQFATAGLVPTAHSYLLDGYSGRQRQDNSRVHIAVRMVNQMADPLIKVPSQPAAARLGDDAQLNPRNRKASTRADEDVRRRCAEEADRLVHTGGTTAAQIPQSATLTSFSSSGSDASAPNGAQHSPPLHSAALNASRFSAPVPPVDSRRVSVPAERASWAAANLDFAQIAPPTAAGAHQAGAISRRMSDDRLAVATAAPPNVPNRIQQTRRDADSVIEELLAEGLQNEAEEEERAPDEAADSDVSSAADRTDENNDKRRLELFVSKKNGDALVLGSNEKSNDRRSPRPPLHHFERVRVDQSLLG
ncbi:Sym-3 [Aphelenchoides fujianensis]|nr:Sym-3 [Aphelenchoides fujianensis]